MNQPQFIVPIKPKPLEGEVVEVPKVVIQFSSITVETARALSKGLNDARAQIREHADGKARPLFPWEKDMDDGAIEIDG